MPLRIAFDLDGVLADMESALVRQAESLFGEAVTRPKQPPTATDEGGTPETESAEPADPAEPAESEDAEPAVPPVAKLEMTSRQQRRLWRQVESISNFWETLQETEPGIVTRLAAIAVERRWEIIFLTTRPATAGATVQMQTQRWLESKGFVLPSVFVVRGSRGRVAAALELDVVVDDRPENCLDVVVDSKARAILVFRFPTSQLPAAARRLGIGVVGSVNDCLDVLLQADSASRDEPGVIDRVRRMLGLKQPAAM